MSEEDILEQMSNVYQVIQVPDMLKLNFTLDFGENGLFGMLSSPKVMSLAIDYMDMALVEMGIKMRIVDDDAREAGDGLMMKTETITYMSIPMLSRKMNLEVSSNIYDDMSLNNDYHLSTESYDDYTGEFVNGEYKGLADLYPCKREESSNNTSIMIHTQETSSTLWTLNLCTTISTTRSMPTSPWNTEFGLLNTRSTSRVRLSTKLPTETSTKFLLRQPTNQSNFCSVQKVGSSSF